MMFDTIAAVSTAPGGAISIVRVSGPKAVELSGLVSTKNLLDAKNRYMYRSSLHLYNREVTFDDALVCVMRNPNSFTGEDTVEFYCHGGTMAPKTLIKELISAGCRQAHPGEFSRRAFLNGRIDLTAAEAISDIINAKTEDALTLAASNSEGLLYNQIEGYRKELIALAAHLAAILDYPDEGVEDITTAQSQEQISNLACRLEQLLNTAGQGAIIQNGLNVVIAGKPNTGKSSLLNLLLGQDRAIVTPIEGTTRDLLCEQALINGYLVNLTDTAGIRETLDVVEGIGVERSISSLDAAHLVLVVQDASRELDQQDMKLLELTAKKNRIIVVNKQDIKNSAHTGDVYISAKTGEGLTLLCKMISDFAAAFDPVEGQIYLTNKRQEGIVMRAAALLKNILDPSLTIDIILCELENAIECLGEMTGNNVSEDIIEAVFENFCVGK